MRLISICACLAAALVLLCAAQSPVQARKTSTTSISALVVTDMTNDESGFGIALNQRGQTNSDIAYLDLGAYTLIQTAQLAGSSFGGFPVYYGIAAGFANSKEDLEEIPDGFMTGIEIVLASGGDSKGIKIDARAGSMTEGFKPLSWFSDPDTFWAAIGLSLSF